MSNRTIGPFELGDKLGVGGMGVVYRATYTKTGIACAIKVLAPDVNDSPGVQQRFEREIAILKKLQHPHIVRYYGGGRVGSQRFYAMELVQGGSLEQHLKKRGKLPWKEALGLVRQVAEALEHAHTAGVIHRDLKPANLLLAPDGKLKLTDFGIARDTTATALTAAGKTVGTYAYMAPEQIRGKPPVDRRTDLYALGCVLFEMLAGEPPFDSDNPGELLVKHLQDDPPRVTSFAPECPIWLEEMVFKLLEKDPEERYYDALALQVAIDEVLKQVDEQEKLVGATLGGQATHSVGAAGMTQVKDATGKKKKKKKRDLSPFYEQPWFLGICLVALLAIIITPFVWKDSESALLSKAEPLMASGDSIQWQTARDKYLRPLLQRFPKGEHAAKAQEYVDQVDMHFLENQARTRQLGNRPTKSDAERFYLEADKYERFGDRVQALEKYESLIELLTGREGDDRLWSGMAHRQAEKIRAAGLDKRESTEILEDNLKRADELAENGKLIEARNIWDSVIELYKDNQELEIYVERARERRKPKSRSQD